MAFVVQQSLITLVSLSCHGNSFLWSGPSFGNHFEYCDGDCGIDGDDGDTSDNGTWRQDRWRPRSVSWETKGRQREVDLVEEMVRRGFISGWRSRRVLWKMSEQDNVKSLRWSKTTLLYLCYNLSATPWPEATDRRWRSIEKSGELSQGSSWKRHSWWTSWRWWSMDKYEELSQSSSWKRQQFLSWSW